jgi:metallo-beta-lactamase family protein
MTRFQVLDYAGTLEILPGVRLTFRDAGHILGSAGVQLHIDDGERVRRIFFTGDTGRYVDRLLPEPVRFPQADVILCETTYGDREHQPVAEAEAELLKHVVQVCVERKGKLIIPAFSIGKTQEILYTLNRLSNAGRLPRIPVHVDSPLAISATEIVRDHAALFRHEVRDELDHDPDLFSFPGVEFVRSPDRSKQLNGTPGPRIIIAASGMMEAGRIRHHLLHELPKPENAVLAVGYCAPGTLGADLLDGYQEVRIFGDPVPVRAQILRMEFYSAHADRNELLRYLSCQDPNEVEKIFLIHGVDRARRSFKELLEANNFRNILLPRQRETFAL